MRLRYIDEQKAIVTVRHRWINQNPFKSYVLGSSRDGRRVDVRGAMVMNQIKKSGRNISMLVANNNANFSKKATGKITFTCEDGHLIADAIRKGLSKLERDRPFG